MASGANHAANFDHFCERCHSFLNRDGGKEGAYMVPWLHSKLGNIQFTAQSGCHLCSILIRCIEQTYRNELAQTLISLYLKGNILRIQVGSDATRHTPLLRLESLEKEGLTLVNHYRQNTSTLTRKQRTLAQITRSLQECQNHALCQHQAGVKLPTRLLYLYGQHLRLVDAEGVLSIDTKYMTLSHRWPKVPGMKLTKNTLTEFQNGISLTSVPTLFREFCELSLEASVSYTWIDALCIVQDDDQDWARESALMAYVYTNSQLNIIAGCSQQHETIYPQGNVLSLSPAIITESVMAKTLDINAVFTFNPDEKEQIARLPTDHRAWILQECELSPRMVYFGDTEMVWECASTMLCESSQPGGINWSQTHFGDRSRRVRSQIARFRQDYIGLSEARCQSIWTGLVSKYTSADITLEKDRLVAISGLSQYLQRWIPDQLGKYHAGLWESGFERQLLWRSYDSSGVVLSKQYLAPSWSWASHTSRIAYYGSPPGALSVLSLIENLTVSTVPKFHATGHGELKDGYFTCLANLCQVYLSYEQVGPLPAFVWSVQTLASSTRLRIDLSITLDHPNDISATSSSLEPFRNFYLMPLLCYDVDDHEQEYKIRPTSCRLFTDWHCSDGITLLSSLPKGRWGLPSAGEDLYSLAALILSPVPGKNGHFVRAGIAEFGSPDAIMLLQEACKSSLLMPEMYCSMIADRHAYNISVC